MKFECQIKEGERVYFKSKNKNIEGEVKRIFKLFSEDKINDYAFIVVNENNLELVINVKELSLYLPVEITKESIQAFEKYYLVKYRFQDIEAGTILCLFEDSVTRENKIYSRDLDVLIHANITKIIIDKIGEDRYGIDFKAISKKESKFLYPIKPIGDRLDIDMKSIDCIKNQSFVFYRQENERGCAAVHEIVEIGGFNFLLLHVTILLFLLFHFLLKSFHL
jgi:hypothetical protein